MGRAPLLELALIDKVGTGRPLRRSASGPWVHQHRQRQRKKDSWLRCAPLTSKLCRRCDRRLERVPPSRRPGNTLVICNRRSNRPGRGFPIVRPREEARSERCRPAGDVPAAANEPPAARSPPRRVPRAMRDSARRGAAALPLVHLSPPDRSDRERRNWLGRDGAHVYPNIGGNTPCVG